MAMYFWNAQGKIERFVVEDQDDEDATIRYIFFFKTTAQQGMLAIGEIIAFVKNPITGNLDNLFISRDGRHSSSKPLATEFGLEKAFDGSTASGFATLPGGELMVDLGVTIKYKDMKSIVLKRRDDLMSLDEFANFHMIFASEKRQVTKIDGKPMAPLMIKNPPFYDQISIEFDKSTPYVLTKEMGWKSPPDPVAHFELNKPEVVIKNERNDRVPITFNRRPDVSKDPVAVVMSVDLSATSRVVDIMTNNGYTFEILFSISEAQPYYPLICGLSLGNNKKGVQIQLDPEMRVYMWNSYTQKGLKALNKLSLDTWYHVIISSNGNIYINGMKAFVEGSSRRIENVPRILSVGDIDRRRSFKGKIKMLKFYDRELDMKEVFGAFAASP